MEMSFFTMGSAVAAGGLFGGLSGLYLGIKETKNLKGNVKYSQLINFVTKRGSVSAQSFGAVALMFSLYDTLFYQVRDVDDELNKVVSATLTGVTYSLPHGVKRMAKGGIVGLILASGYLGYTHFDFLKSKFSSSGSSSTYCKTTTSTSTIEATQQPLDKRTTTHQK